MYYYVRRITHFFVSSVNDSESVYWWVFERNCVHKLYSIKCLSSDQFR